jgi:hypothetical protein
MEVSLTWSVFMSTWSKAQYKAWRQANPVRCRQYYLRAKEWLARNPDKRMRYALRSRATRLGISVEMLQRLLEHKVCDACGSGDPGCLNGFHVDHSHVTGHVRGVLCQSCNLICGHAKDNPIKLRRVAHYLEHTNG